MTSYSPYESKDGKRIRKMSIEMLDCGLLDIHIEAEKNVTLDEILNYFNDMLQTVDGMITKSKGIIMNDS